MENSGLHSLLRLNLPVNQRFIELVNQFVDQHLDDPELSIGQVAAELKISRATLFRKIKSRTGVSPSTYICQRKLMLARLLLKQSDLQVNDIAYTLGFNSPSYFTRKFRDHYNMSPSQFRNTHS